MKARVCFVLISELHSYSPDFLIHFDTHISFNRWCLLISRCPLAGLNAIFCLSWVIIVNLLLLFPIRMHSFSPLLRFRWQWVPNSLLHSQIPPNLSCSIWVSPCPSALKSVKELWNDKNCSAERNWGLVGKDMYFDMDPVLVAISGWTEGAIDVY